MDTNEKLAEIYREARYFLSLDQAARAESDWFKSFLTCRINIGWAQQPSECCRLHSVGLYILVSNVESLAIIKTWKSPLSAGSPQMRLGFW
ncbi:hypothetical protein AWB77_00520 [Caballeronia fortuita]|uniref:Uncharacterized protein n=1 Tax=Caballeronia fortuita TaxID=1777138 RepID=A0A157ZBQ7_9BURK|nr:hypothetical protein AWB77_00520 [Caballeronia fortuita]